MKLTDERLNQIDDKADYWDAAGTEHMNLSTADCRALIAAARREKKLVEALGAVYAAMLLHAPITNPARHTAGTQAALSMAVDAIADATDREPYDVQTGFEAAAIRNLAKGD